MKHAVILAAAAGLTMTTPAAAADLTFTLTGDYTATFTLDSSPDPDDYLTGGYFTIFDVPGFSDALLGVADVTFFNADFDGGFEADDFYGESVLLATDGPQLYTGPESAPTFILGTYSLSQYQGTGRYTLTIASAAVGSVPEPASWAMMIAGFGLVGGALRSRRSLAVSFG